MENSLRLLLVEDSQEDALLLLYPLRKAGYQLEVERVLSLEAVRSALSSKTWDMIISDYVLPGFTAHQVLELVQSFDLDLPFIVVSGSMGEETAVAVMRAGAHDYLLKESLSRLVPAIERELREAEVRRQKRQAEAALRQAYEGLESLVQQRTAELQIANESLQQLAAIVESSNDAIMSTTLDGIILSWNKGAEKTYGYCREEAQGHSITTLVCRHNPVYIDEQKDQQTQKTVHYRKDGTAIDVFLTISPVKSSAGIVTGQSWIVRDISELQAVEKMKDEFVSVVSHELRTPLTSIRASLGLMLMGRLGELPEACQPFLQVAVNNTDRLVRLINDILDLERLNAAEVNISPQLCNLNDLMMQSLQLMQGSANAANVQLKANTLSITVCVDHDRMIQTLTNLLSNAIKFSAPQSVVELSAALHPGEVWIAVKDQGRGIPSDKIERIFGRFQQVDASDSRQQGGTGLGLAICKSIVNQHGGRIWVESILGAGSTFFFTLPIDPI
ncbi:multi-sensor signal transduction histidine kinase [Leptolyngbya boryana NIES-2135]|jgi:two-component system sensor histidine kinase VicK|uniref:histidine kinase n=1 Tax=Leptolyngbya boryana NIES-2135 TaxID=1973484 RepID=A0A1Z4JPN2_LEPBY|nr:MULTISPECIES: ATP-binding protein [Leptolyngbya]BAY58682.1 multi-sensor signal transduction histidine kinase [Leptolyngbya boryana NIES-2135]MBD2371070.1 PAS domain S-box protein [Leptolyngbya sp. FACHB-161]MBD2377264.1 PAS domain S-box protein [Leptolyngbya sp. FACHB-238]MBD2401992.1 PAS domain S-box protein [Leptolyngbya sp. FACHB-239]MBD2408510.1 PAS domain S-box protein [Leptolyngbya sp. FACHB-402]